LGRLRAEQDDMSTALLALDDHLGYPFFKGAQQPRLDIARASLAGAPIAPGNGRAICPASIPAAAAASMATSIFPGVAPAASPPPVASLIATLCPARPGGGPPAGRRPGRDPPAGAARGRPGSQVDRVQARRLAAPVADRQGAAMGSGRSRPREAHR